MQEIYSIEDIGDEIDKISKSKTHDLLINMEKNSSNSVKILNGAIDVTLGSAKEIYNLLETLKLVTLLYI